MKEKPQLNEAQKKAVFAPNKSLLIVAGAGTGKTKVLTHRLVHLLQSGVPHWGIVVMTFTNKAAKEMTVRAKQLLSQQPSPFIGTFHSFGVSFLRKYGEVGGVKSNFDIFDRNDSLRVIKRIKKAEGIEEYPPKDLLNIVSELKQGRVGGNRPVLSVGRTILPLYEKILKDYNSLDFDDLLIKPVQILQTSSEIRKATQKKYKHILVDEFQDINNIQGRLIKLLRGKDAYVFAVGDMDQTIYSWRGASISNMLEFKKTFAPAELILLEENYRSASTILSAANRVISQNTERVAKKLFTKNKKVGEIVVSGCDDPKDEALQVVDRIKKLRETYKYKDMVVLYRTNAQSRSIEESCIEGNIPYAILGTRFFARAEVQLLVRYLRYAYKENPNDLQHIINTPSRYIGEKGFEKYLKGEAESLPNKSRKGVQEFERIIKNIQSDINKYKISKVFEKICKYINLDQHFQKSFENITERKENVKELLDFSNQFDSEDKEEALTNFFDRVLLGSEQDEMDHSDKSDVVMLMTIHAAKGLEFPVVFVVGCEEGLLPHAESQSKKQGEEEERRLCYVAITRAKEKLFMSYALIRGGYEGVQITEPSRFLEDIQNEKDFKTIQY